MEWIAILKRIDVCSHPWIVWRVPCSIDFSSDIVLLESRQIRAAPQRRCSRRQGERALDRARTQTNRPRRGDLQADERA